VALRQVPLHVAGERDARGIKAERITANSWRKALGSVMEFFANAGSPSVCMIWFA
jgi:hypothetical protein